MKRDLLSPNPCMLDLVHSIEALGEQDDRIKLAIILMYKVEQFKGSVPALTIEEIDAVYRLSEIIALYEKNLGEKFSHVNNDYELP